MTIFTSPFAEVELKNLSITERVFEGLIDRPNETVLTDGQSGSALSAAAFMDRVKSLAGGLTERGLGSDHTIALMAPKSPDYCTVFHGIAWAGGTVTTINPTYTEHEIRHQLQDSSAEMLVTIPAFLETAKTAIKDTKVSEIIVIGEAQEAVSLSDLMSTPLDQQVPVDLDKHVVVLPYSSGTTGIAKGVRLSHRNLGVNVDQSLEVVTVRPGEVTAAF